MANRTLFTIGYEAADLVQVLTELTLQGVDTLVDVRAVAMSRRPGFSKTRLAAALAAEGIKYIHLRDLGDPKPGREAAKTGDYKRFREIYKDHLSSSEAKVSLALLGDLASSRSVCLLCYERAAVNCHRSLIGMELEASSPLSIIHLQPQSRERLQSRTMRHSHQGSASCRAEAW